MYCKWKNEWLNEDAMYYKSPIFLTLKSGQLLTIRAIANQVCNCHVLYFVSVSESRRSQAKEMAWCYRSTWTRASGMVRWAFPPHFAKIVHIVEKRYSFWSILFWTMNSNDFFHNYISIKTRHDNLPVFKYITYSKLLASLLMK